MINAKGNAGRLSVTIKGKKEIPEPQKIVANVSAKAHRLLVQESKRRHNATGARWPIGAIISELTIEKYGSKANGGGDAHEFPERVTAAG